MQPPLRLLSDDALVRAARSGTDEAVGEIARRHGPRLRRQCERVVGPDRADDAVQQALANALIALRRAGDERPIDLDRWLSRLAHNASIDVLRRGMPPWAQLDERIDGVPRPSEIAARRAELRSAVDRLQALPERQRRALVAHVFEGRSWAEIGTELDIGEPAVRQLLHRARTRMRAAAAVVIAPFWALHGSSSARAAGLLGGAGGAKALGGAVAVVVVAGGIAAHGAGTHHTSPVVATVRHRASVARRPDVPAAPAARMLRDTGHSAPAHRARRPAVRAAAPSHAVRHGSAAPLTRATAPRATPPGQHRHEAVAGPPDRHTASAAPQTATVPSAPQPAAAPSPASSEPAATPVPPPAQDAPVAPAPPPASAPPAIAHVSAWSKGTGYGGYLAIESQSGAGVTTGFLGELTDLTCVHAEQGVVVSSGACTPASITVGTLVSVAQSGTNPSSGQPVWTHVQLLT